MADDDVPVFVYAHSLVMFFAWGVFGSLALITARVRARNSWWFVPHIILSLCAIALTLAGLILGIAGKGWKPIEFDWVHKWLGIFIVAGCGLQGLLGLLAHLLYKPGRTSQTIVDHFHGILGRSLWLASAYQMFVGVSSIAKGFDDVAGTGLVAAYTMWMAIAGSFVLFSDVSGYDKGNRSGDYGHLQEVASQEF